jgi:hypothetical protein
MKTPVIVVALTLTAAILVAASLVILAGTRKSNGTSTLNTPSLAAYSRTTA